MKIASNQTSYAVIIACILLIISCKNKTKNDMDMTELNSFGKNYAQAWSSQKPEQVSKFFSPDGSLTVNDGDPAIGTEAITNVARGFMNAFPDMIVTMDCLVTKYNKTQFHWTLIGANTGAGGTGNKVRISGFEEWIFNEDGLAQKYKGSFDSEEYNRQLIEGVIE